MTPPPAERTSRARIARMSAAERSKLPPTPMARAPRPELGNDPIPKERYTSPEFMRREWEGTQKSYHSYLFIV